ncbi:hypothetical protein ACFFX0_26440 [Citricoccus parietis]|uniref:Uncharacterized protein n=1 Tax=Citricoccus parietis TaxID=592307 RepID=A0ABV5G6F7_9MICC
MAAAHYSDHRKTHGPRVTSGSVPSRQNRPASSSCQETGRNPV